VYHENHCCGCFLSGLLGGCFLYTGGDQKNLIGLRSYPEKAQERVRTQKNLADKVPAAKSVSSILLGNVILFTVVFSILGLLLKSALGLNSYGAAFL
jgi:hypothetical protein